MDVSKYSIVLMSLEASASQGVYLTNAGFAYDYRATTYTGAEALKFEIPPISSMMEGKDCLIKNIPITGTFLTQLANNMPFSKVTVDIKMLDINMDTDVVETVHYLFNGLVYQVKPFASRGYLDLVAKDWKYYTDIVAGLPCTEQCSWSVLGGRGCGASVSMEIHTVESVSGLDLTIVGSLTDTTPLLFNKGYVELEGVRIRIKYHNTGSTFQLSKPPPSSWVGSAINVYSGCDRRLTTCKNIYNNEVNFMGLGYSMIDYNPLYEQP